MTPRLKAPGTNLLTLKYDEPLSTFTNQFQLAPLQHEPVQHNRRDRQKLTLVPISAQLELLCPLYDPN
jgi:hypothetical protein